MLSDACQPGKVSSLSTVQCPNAYLASALDHGAVQITLETGYFLLRGQSDVLHVEFRGKDDTTTSRAVFRISDVESALRTESKFVAFAS